MKKFILLVFLILLPPVLYVIGVRYGLPPVMDIIANGECTDPGAFTADGGVCVDRLDYTPNPLGIAFATMMATPFVVAIAVSAHSLFHRIMRKHV